MIIFLAIALRRVSNTEHNLRALTLRDWRKPGRAAAFGISIRKPFSECFASWERFRGCFNNLHARVGSDQDAGQLLEIDAIAACVIGGTSLMGDAARFSVQSSAR